MRTKPIIMLVVLTTVLPELFSGSTPLRSFFFFGLAAVVTLYAWQLRRLHWLALPTLAVFGLGWYLHNALQAALFISVPAGQPGRAAATLIVDLLILATLFWDVRSRLTSTPPVPAMTG